MMKSASLLPTSASTVNSLGEPLDQVALDRGVERDRPVGDLDVAQARARAARRQPVDPALADRELGQRAAEHDRNAVRRIALELRPQVRADERRAPAELHDVDDLAGDLEHAVDLGDREASVDHMRDAVLARLRRARRDVEEAGYGTAVAPPPDDSSPPPADALSSPTITTTEAAGASAATEPSSGCTCDTESEWATRLGVGLVAARVLDDGRLVGARRPPRERSRLRVAALLQFTGDAVCEARSCSSR